MIIRRRRPRFIVGLLILSSLLTGCTAIAPILASGIRAGARYSFLNSADKTETYPLRDVYMASMRSFRGMGVDIVGIVKNETGRTIEATTSQRAIFARLERVTPNVTKVIISVRKGPLFRDKATAEEIIRQLDIELAKGKRDRKKRKKAMLSAIVMPEKAVVRIMNIGPRFYQGMELREGEYEIEVSAPDFEPVYFWIHLDRGEERLLEVTLTQLR